MAIAGPIPGMAPIINPPIAPITSASITEGCRRLDSPSQRNSISARPQNHVFRNSDTPSGS